jgi:hypothetical protein
MFGSESVALRTARDLIMIAMRYKLRMFGVPLEGPAQVFCNNQGVVKYTSVPESALTKKHNTVNYHAVKEAAAAGVLEVRKIQRQISQIYSRRCCLLINNKNYCVRYSTICDDFVTSSV